MFGALTSNTTWLLSPGERGTDGWGWGEARGGSRLDASSLWIERARVLKNTSVVLAVGWYVEVWKRKDQIHVVSGLSSYLVSAIECESKNDEGELVGTMITPRLSLVLLNARCLWAPQDVSCKPLGMWVWGLEETLHMGMIWVQIWIWI